MEEVVVKYNDDFKLINVVTNPNAKSKYTINGYKIWTSDRVIKHGINVHFWPENGFFYREYIFDSNSIKVDCNFINKSIYEVKECIELLDDARTFIELAITFIQQHND